MCGYKNVTSLMSGIDFFVFFSCEMMRVHWNTYFSEYTNESRRGTSFSKTEFLSNVSGGSHAKTKKKSNVGNRGKR